MSLPALRALTEPDPSTVLQQLVVKEGEVMSATCVAEQETPHSGVSERGA